MWTLRDLLVFILCPLGFNDFDPCCSGKLTELPNQAEYILRTTITVPNPSLGVFSSW
jgi:hypothetical protein